MLYYLCTYYSDLLPTGNFKKYIEPTLINTDKTIVINMPTTIVIILIYIKLFDYIDKKYHSFPGFIYNIHFCLESLI